METQSVVILLDTWGYVNTTRMTWAHKNLKARGFYY